MRSSFLLFLLLLEGTRAAAGPSTLDHVEALSVERLAGSPAVFFSSGCGAHAERVQSILARARRYFAAQCGLDETFAVAVLTASDWAPVSRVPYGLSFISGPPQLVCLPGDAHHELARLVASAIAGRGLEARFGMDADRLVETFVDLIGFHELGHLYARAGNGAYPSKWSFEFAASYFAYAALKAEFPAHAELWQAVSRALEEAITPARTRLQDFEERYVQLGVTNYAWYQVVLLERVTEVFAEQGEAFLATLQQIPPEPGGDAFGLEIFEERQPGFYAWARRHGLLSTDSPDH